MYAGDIVELNDLVPTEEAARVTLWDLRSDIGDVDEIDRALVDLYVSA